MDIQTFDVLVGDRLLLCSDGLTEELSDSLIAASLLSHPEDEKAATELIKGAKEKGGRDNITVAIVTIEE
jgi:protein phosphatase